MVPSVLTLCFALLLGLVKTGIDILAFFIVVRMIMRTRRAPRWIVAFDAAGGVLIEGFLQILSRGLVFLTGAHLREETKLVLALLILWIFRCSLG